MVSREEEIIQESLAEFSEMQTWRAQFAQQWEEVAELVLPTSRNTFFYGSFNFPGEKKTQQQVDATAMMALSRFGAIMDSLLTPRNSKWHGVQADNSNLMKARRVRLYYEEVTRLLFKYRYSPIANFSAQNQNVYQGLGAFGTSNLFVDTYQGVDGAVGLRYKAIPLGEMFLRENHQGLVDGFVRWYRLTARQAKQAFPETVMPEKIEEAAEKGSLSMFNFIHRVCPRKDYDGDRLDARGKIFASYNICLDTKTLMREGGYNTFPLASTRYEQTPGEVYGRSPAMAVLPALKTLNAEKRDFLTQGHRAATPPLLTTDDGAVDASLRPGALMKGGMSADGRHLIAPLVTGNIQITKEMMDEERSLINDAFLVTLFQILRDRPALTATQVVEEMNEKGILLAPTVGRQQSEYLGPLIDREIDLLAQLGVLPPMPPELVEARGEYSVEYTSPLSKIAQAQEVSGALRSLEQDMQIVQATGDVSLLDNYDFDQLVPDKARMQSTPERWLADAEKIAAKRQARAAAAQRQEQIQAAPAAAAMMKAQAAAAKTPGGDQSSGGGQ